MVWQDWINMDFDKVFKSVLLILFKIVKYPFELFHRLPWWIKTTFFILIILFALFISWQMYKRRNEWRECIH